MSGPSLIDRLRRDGLMPAALSFLLGIDVPADKTTRIRCFEPGHHKNGDRDPSAVVKPRVGRVQCARTGVSWGLFEIGVIKGIGTTKAEVAKVLEQHFYGSGAASGRSAPPKVVPPDAMTDAVQALGGTVTERDGVVTWTFPVLGPDFELRGNKYRKQRRGKKRTFSTDKGMNAGMIGLEQLRTADPLAVVFLTEGEHDACRATMAIQREGLLAIALCASNGAGQSLAEFAALLAGREVYVTYDEDKSGREGSTARVRELTEHARSCARVELPFTESDREAEYKDLAHWLDHCGGTMRRLLDRAQAQRADGPISRRLSDVPLEAITWLWDGRLPNGKLVILDGDPGLGKSTITLDIAARVTRGAAMPLADEGRPPACVILLSAEDGAGDTIRPRMEAAGADLTRVFVLDGVLKSGEHEFLEVPGDVEHLRTVIEREHAKLVVIDPLVSYLGEKTDTHRDKDVRKALRALAEVARQTGCCILVVRHLNKVEGGKALYRGGGSIGIVAAARVGMLVGLDPDDENRRVISITKCNLAPKAESLSYELVERLVSGCKVAVVVWVGASAHSADDLVLPKKRRGAKLGAATAFLARELSDGPGRVGDLRARAANEGISKRTLDRAKEALKVKSYRLGSLWLWRLPDVDPDGGGGCVA